MEDTFTADTAEAALRSAVSRLAEVAELDLESVPAGRLPALTQTTQRLIRSAEALSLRLTAAADTARVAERQGARSTTSWMAQTTDVTSQQASKDVRLARQLADAAPQTRRALTEARLGKEKARIVAGAMDTLPSDLSEGDRAHVESSLLDKADTLRVEDLRRAARRAVEVVDPVKADHHEAKALERREREAWRSSELVLSEEDDAGMVTGRFTIGAMHAAFLRSALEALTSPRYAAAHGLDDADAPYPKRLGRAFCHILEHLPTDGLADHGGVGATVVVNLDLETLTEGIGAATLTDGTRISAGEARRIACNAGLIPAVFGGSSVPLDLGRERRLFSRHQRLALAQRDRGCAFPGCDVPPGWCEAHHLTDYAEGGRTDLSNGVLLCARHHRSVGHSGDWSVSIAQDGQPEFIPPPWVDPRQRPRRSTRYRPERTRPHIAA